MPAQEAFRSVAEHALAKGGEPIKIIGVLCDRAPFLAEMKCELQAELYSKDRLHFDPERCRHGEAWAACALLKSSHILIEHGVLLANAAVLLARGQAGSSMFSHG